MMRYLFIGLAFVLLFTDSLFGQEQKKPKWQLQGYISDMISTDRSSETLHLDNLIHNRLNFKWFPTEYLNFRIELRNRLFYGYSVKSIPEFGEIVDRQNDFFDLSFQFPKNERWMLHGMLDRAFLEWYKNDWEIRVGRQRINWGVNLIWNPNDLFNAYSFYDFDYMERPGSDALLLKKYLGNTSSIEFAMNATDKLDDLIIASRYVWNKWNYDFQVIGAKAKNDLILGAAWAGNIKKAGFKGETSFFYPFKDRNAFSPLIMAVISVDYAFKNTLYLQSGILYNSLGSDEHELLGIGFVESSSIPPRNLSPFAWSVFLQSRYQLHPLSTGGIAVVYFPGKRNAVFINPSLSYSLKENVDLDFILQLYYDELLGNYEAIRQTFFMRIKWSF